VARGGSLSRLREGGTGLRLDLRRSGEHSLRARWAQVWREPRPGQTSFFCSRMTGCGPTHRLPGSRWFERPRSIGWQTAAFYLRMLMSRRLPVRPREQPYLRGSGTGAWAKARILAELCRRNFPCIPIFSNPPDTTSASFGRVGLRAHSNQAGGSEIPPGRSSRASKNF
jgi:hypothetical protein